MKKQYNKNFANAEKPERLFAFFTVGAIHALLTNHIEPLLMKPCKNVSSTERRPYKAQFP